jgi:hypothetical protein
MGIKLLSPSRSDIPTKVLIVHINSQRSVNEKIVVRELDDTTLLVNPKVEVGKVTCMHGRYSTPEHNQHGPHGP